jgi:hypothetical protein
MARGRAHELHSQPHVALNRKKVSYAIRTGFSAVGTVHERTHPDENGIKHQRAEVRFDDVAGLSSHVGARLVASGNLGD